MIETLNVSAGSISLIPSSKDAEILDNPFDALMKAAKAVQQLTTTFSKATAPCAYASFHTRERKGTTMSLKALLAAAGIAVGALGVSAPAQAHDGYYDRGYSDRSYRDYDRWDRRDYRDWRDDRRWREHRRWKRSNWRDGRHYGWNDRRGRDCWREWYRGRRVIVCR